MSTREFAPIWEQTKTSFDEAWGLLSRAGRYARAVAERLLQSERPKRPRRELQRFCRTCAAAGASVVAILDSARKAEQDRRAGGPQADSDELRSWIEECFQLLPGLLSALTASYLQRKQKGIQQFFTRATTGPSFSLSEIDLSYSVSARGTETLVEWYHDALSPFWGAIPCSPRVTAITSEDEVALLSPDVLELPLLAEELDVHLGHALNAGYFLLPRWLPAQLRFASALGHETFHQVLSLATIWRDWKLRLAEVSWRDPPPSKEEMRDNAAALAYVFTDQVIDLEDMRSDLTALVSDFLVRHQIPGPDSQRESDQEFRSAICEQNAEEILSDVAALVLSGPAYLYYLACQSYASPSEEERDFRGSSGQPPDHPPSYARIMFCNHLLRDVLGFEEHANHFEASESEGGLGFGETWRRVAETSSFTKEYCEELLLSDEVRHLCEACVKMIAEGAEGAGHRPYTVVARKGTEEWWTTQWDNIIRKASKQQVLKTDLPGCAPPDILNAIWRRMLRAEYAKLPRLRMEWRLALRNLGR